MITYARARRITLCNGPLVLDPTLLASRVIDRRRDGLIVADRRAWQLVLGVNLPVAGRGDPHHLAEAERSGASRLDPPAEDLAVDRFRVVIRRALEPVVLVLAAEVSRERSPEDRSGRP